MAELNSDKAFWAMNYNMAVNNLITVVRHIGREGHSATEDDHAYETAAVLESEVVKILRNRGNLVQKQRVIRALVRYLPFLGCYRAYYEEPPKAKDGEAKKPLRQLAPNDMADFLCYCAKLLISIRNNFSHGAHEEYSLELSEKYQQYTRVFQAIFDANVRTVKSRFYAQVSDDMEADSQANRDAEKVLFNIFRRLRGLDRETGKPKENPNFKFPLFNDNNFSQFTPDWGLAFFASLFLEPMHVSLMMDQILKNLDGGATCYRQGCSNAESDKIKQAVKRVFLVRAVRLPRTRLVCEERVSDSTLGMDMLSELMRCPAQLFELISSDDQKKFRAISPEAPRGEILMRRFKDRYPYFALNYLDRKEKLKRIRFHVNMGNYYFGLHERPLIDGTSLPDRRMRKRILSFAQIQQAEAWYCEDRNADGTLYWSTLEGGNPPAEYRTDMMPQYHINDQQIGLQILGKLQNGGHSYNLSKPEVHEVQGRMTHNPKPACWLSLYELPIFVFLVAAGRERDVEDRIIQYVENWYRFLQEMSRTKTVPDPATFGLDVMDLPEDLRYYLKNGVIRPYRTDLLEKEIQRQIERTERMQERFKDEQTRDFTLGKQMRRRYKGGRIAAMITRELLLFQPANEMKPKKGKISSPDFAVLRASLSLFGEMKDSLRDLFQRAGLLNNPDYPHPFLNQLMESDMISLFAFYENYLKAKLVFFKNLQRTMNSSGEVNWQTGNFYLFRRYFRRQKARNAGMGYLWTLAERLQSETINLPRNLFQTLVQEVVQQKYPQQFQEECGTLSRCNSTFLMMKYNQWSEERTDSFPWPWYYGLRKSKRASGYKKLFELLGKDATLDNQSVRILKDKVKEAQEEEREMLTRLLHRFDATEKDIRHEQIRDFTTILIVRELLGIPNLCLSAIKEGDSGLLDQMQENVTCEVVVPGDSETKYAIQEQVMKTKNFGNFQRMIHDTRLPSFLRLRKQFKGRTTVRYDYLKSQFDVFDRCRREVFQYIFDIERVVLEMYPELQDGQTYVSFDRIVERSGLAERSQLELSFLRNAFAHSYYPDYQLDPVKMCGAMKEDPEEVAKAEKSAKIYQPELDKILKKFWVTGDGEKEIAVARRMADRVKELHDRIISNDKTT